MTRSAGHAEGDRPEPHARHIEERWAELISTHLPGLRAYVAVRVDRLVDARESRADIVQSVCREVLEHMHRFVHGSEDEFRQWLYRTAERKIIDRYRYWKAEKRDAARDRPQFPHEGLPQDWDEPATGRASPSEEAIAREELVRTSRAFDELPAHYREVIVLSRLSGLPHAEIAQRLGKSEGAVRNLLYRGLAALTDRLRAADAARAGEASQFGPAPTPPPAGRPSAGC